MNIGWEFGIVVYRKGGTGKGVGMGGNGNESNDLWEQIEWEQQKSFPRTCTYL